MVADGTTSCSAGVRSVKEKKNLGEICKYLNDHRIDRTRILRKVGNVLVCDLVALKQVEGEQRAGQRQQKGTAVGYCSCGAAYPPRDNRGGDRRARRKRQRVNRGSFRDNRTVSRVLAQTLSPLQGGSVSRIPETPSKLQILQQFAVAGSGNGNSIRSETDQAIYVGITSPTNRLAITEKVQKKKEDDGQKDKEENGKTDKNECQSTEETQLNKSVRTIDDGLLLVVPARVNGHVVRALIDSGATRCFVTPSCVTAVGLKGTPRDIFLELGNGQKYLSRGHVPDVPVVTAGLTVRVGLTVTNLLHEVDLVLGMNWLQLVSPVVDWSSGKIYLPNSVHIALLHGDWLSGHVKAGTVTVLAGS